MLIPSDGILHAVWQNMQSYFVTSKVDIIEMGMGREDPVAVDHTCNFQKTLKYLAA